MADFPELDAFTAQARQLEALLDELEPDDLERDTRLEGWTARDLIAHIAGALHVSTSLARDRADEAATVDRGTWYEKAYDPDAQAEGIRDRSREEAEKRSDPELLDWCRREVADALDVFAGDASAVVGRKGIFIELGELVAARNVELGVHTMDLGHATMKGERLAPESGQVIAGILDRMLGEAPPKALGWSPRTYVLTAAGRRRLEPNERHTLGPLADRFPLIR